jgi:DNA ligase-1
MNIGRRRFLLRLITAMLVLLCTEASFVCAKKPDLFLLKSYQHSQNVDGWIMSEKFDGVRAYWDGHQLISRGGHVFNSPAWFTRGFPPFELDGELWTKRNDFSNIVSIVRKQSPTENWSQISYHVFEVPHQPGGLLERLAVLRFYLQSQGLASTKHGANIFIVPQIEIKNDASLNVFFKQVTEAGGEGVVIRNPANFYQTGRLKSALKMKPFQDAECTVTGYRPGRGKYLGLTGALKCRMQNNKVIHIGSGLSDPQRKAPPAMGTVITFKHYGLTKKGMPRFPVYLRIRNSE